jgi:outer membrane protein TolC
VSPLVPKSLEEALALADRLNPQILAAAFNADAARHNIDLAVGALLPTISLEAEYRAARQPDLSVIKNEHAAVLGVLQMPLYQAGRVASQVREAKQVASQRRIEIVEAGRAVREAVVRTWNIFIAAGETIESLRAQVAANELALEGVRQEAQVGTRTTLDVLDAERLLVTSQVSLVTAQREQIVAAYQLIAATGRMTARNLRLPVAAYEPDEHYLKTRGRWIGIGTDTVD